MNIRFAVAASALAISLAAASAAGATTVISDLTVNGASGGLNVSAPYGKVTVDDAGGTLAFTVDLTNGLVFRNAPDGNHWSFGFDLNVATGGIGSITDNGTGTFTVQSGSHNFSPFGSFNYVLECDSCSTGYNANSPTQLKFVVTAPTTLTVNSIIANGSGNFFAADVADSNGSTGNVGATGFRPPGGIPEPATWAMMLMGFGGLGAVLRTQRRQRALAA